MEGFLSKQLEEGEITSYMELCGNCTHVMTQMLGRGAWRRGGYQTDTGNSWAIRKYMAQNLNYTLDPTSLTFSKTVHNINKWIHDYKIFNSYMNHVLIWRVCNKMTSYPTEALAMVSKLCLHVEIPCIRRGYPIVDYSFCFKKASVHNKISFSVKLIRLYYLEG
jgi:hypothetical protein